MIHQTDIDYKYIWCIFCESVDISIYFKTFSHQSTIMKYPCLWSSPIGKQIGTAWVGILDSVDYQPCQETNLKTSAGNLIETKALNQNIQTYVAFKQNTAYKIYKTMVTSILTAAKERFAAHHGCSNALSSHCHSLIVTLMHNDLG